MNDIHITISLTSCGNPETVVTYGVGIELNNKSINVKVCTGEGEWSDQIVEDITYIDPMDQSLSMR